MPFWDSEDSDEGDNCYGLCAYEEPIVIGGEPHQKPSRVLVCAPSNSALDEIIYRIIHTFAFDISHG